MKKLILLFISGFFLHIMANTFFINNDTMMKDKSGKEIATLTKGTKVKVLKTKADMSKVVVNGWAYEIEPNTEIFYDMGVTVVLANIKENALNQRKVIQVKEDEYEEPWMQSSLEGWVKKSAISSNFKKLWKKESSLATNKCGTCHGAPKVKAYEAVQFPSLINLMKEFAVLSDKEENQIVNYYQKNKIYNIEK